MSYYRHHAYKGFYFFSTRTNLYIELISSFCLVALFTLLAWILPLATGVEVFTVPFYICISIYAFCSLITFVLAIASVNKRKKNIAIGVLSIIFLLIVPGVIYLAIYGTEREKMVDRRNAIYRKTEVNFYNSIFHPDQVDDLDPDIEPEFDIDELLNEK